MSQMQQDCASTGASLYIHIPFCRKKCDYCDFYSVPRPHSESCTPVPENYIASLVSEAAFYAQRYQITRWNTVYIGGGTPSLLAPSQLERLMCGVKKAAPLAPDAEITMEMNPESVTGSLIDAAHSSGINRISLGIQALDDKALSLVHRGCTVQEARRALSLLSRLWCGNYAHELSCDLIAGLPGHTARSFAAGIEELCSYPLNHLSLYTLTVEEGTPLYRRIERGEVTYNPEKADRLWLTGRRLLEKHGFAQYEVSNFAKPGFESRHNSVYWQLENYIGIGSGATGTWYGKPHADGSAGCENGIRWNNSKIMRNAESGMRNEEILDSETQRFEYLMMGFRMLQGVSAQAYRSRFNASLEDAIGVHGGVFSAWKARRLTRTTHVKCADGTRDTRYALNKRGLLLLNRFLEELL